ncbi:MAG: SAM-dependent methyltransferase [Lachnospiraceae bacterium]|nr:SAM-dependent methyltransferase [Lachnospiraceae bacterium]
MTGSDLSFRLKAIADMVPPGMCVYDVGCDHAFLSIYLVKHGGAEGAVASDVNPGPLKAAAEHVAAEGLEDKIRIVLSDGLHNIEKPDRPAVLIIAGMGGPLILDILRESPEVVSAFEQIIISPQSRIEDVRAYVPKLGLMITDEVMVRDADKYYTIIKFVHNRREEPKSGAVHTEPGTGAYGQTDPGWDDCLGDMAVHAYDLYGYKLMSSADPVLMDYLKWEHGVLEGVRSELKDQAHSGRYREVTEDIRLNELIYKRMEGIRYGYDHN